MSDHKEVVDDLRRLQFLAANVRNQQDVHRHTARLAAVLEDVLDFLRHEVMASYLSELPEGKNGGEAVAEQVMEFEIPEGIELADEESAENLRAYIEGGFVAFARRPLLVVTGPVASGKTRLVRAILERVFGVDGADVCHAWPSEDTFWRVVDAGIIGGVPVAWFDDWNGAPTDGLERSFLSVLGNKVRTARKLFTSDLVTGPMPDLVISGLEVPMSERLERCALRVRLA